MVESPPCLNLKKHFQSNPHSFALVGLVFAWAQIQQAQGWHVHWPNWQNSALRLTGVLQGHAWSGTWDWTGPSWTYVGLWTPGPLDYPRHHWKGGIGLDWDYSGETEMPQSCRAWDYCAGNWTWTRLLLVHPLIPGANFGLSWSIHGL